MAPDLESAPQRQPRLPFQRPTAEESNSHEKPRHSTWTMGILNDRQTVEVPGSVLLLATDHNEPLGLRNAPARTSHSSISTGIFRPLPSAPPAELARKKTGDGKIILEPQPDDSVNDPLNWPEWRRDSALLSLGLFCMVGGGMTPILAAGFTDVAEDYDVDVATVSLTTGLYMMGMGLGSVVFSPTAILWGKRPVYLFGAILFVVASIWCAVSPSFTSLVLARIFQGVAVSPVECLPSATIAEIFFLHERAFRIGIYTLLLLGGKNLIPLVSAAIMQRLGWRWVFWIVAIVVSVCGVLLFFFVPETFWDRKPVPKKSRKGLQRPNFFHRYSSKGGVPPTTVLTAESVPDTAGDGSAVAAAEPTTRKRTTQVGFAISLEETRERGVGEDSSTYKESPDPSDGPSAPRPAAFGPDNSTEPTEHQQPFSQEKTALQPTPTTQGECSADTDTESQSVSSARLASQLAYTTALRELPAQSFVQQMKPFHGRLNPDKWHKVAIRPLILFSYPAVLWSAVVYACSVGWLIVISESVAVIYREGHPYHFDALQTGLVYISPFIGGILGTAVAGKVSDIIVKAMARRNGGLYEPEFRLVMAIPVAISTVIGLVGFGWSAQADNHFMVPTTFFGIVSFGCSLGSTTSITFCVDSYRQYAGEALVTLNFSKNILHGLVFSLFVTGWLKADGPKTVYLWIGIIQLILLFFTIPMYIYGKRARMWTVRKNFMERF
ncbi:major facilitator superfamily domain-containing protein [Lasiosphaeria hispida]|uniref:Major facilitator superfamily domain-containing protein n=1 Tax=Lasiosphaeria hispida TaxID=260671 RepID=A0AAJ0H577_9PEZI|nr:major facilitator superfamily domain-containing protein [Lasiosphaeria hispida]